MTFPEGLGSIVLPGLTVAEMVVLAFTPTSFGALTGAPTSGVDDTVGFRNFESSNIHSGTFTPTCGVLPARSGRPPAPSLAETPTSFGALTGSPAYGVEVTFCFG